MTLALDDYTAFMETVPDATLLVNPQGVIVRANAMAEAMFRYGAGAMAGMPVGQLVPQRARAAHAHHERHYAEHGTLRAMGHTDKLNLRGLRHDGTELAVDIMLRPVDLAGQRYTVCVVRDISRLKETEAALQEAVERERELAYTDPVTGVANVRHFHECVLHEVQRFSRYRRPFAVVYMDLDHFKAVNDAQGHQAGDEVLRCVAHSVQKRLRATDCVARLGGDEFGLLLPETGTELARTVVSQLRQQLLRVMEDRGWPVTFSIGVVTCGAAPASVEAVLRQADELMYAAKRAGRNTVRQAEYA